MSFYFVNVFINFLLASQILLPATNNTYLRPLDTQRHRILKLALTVFVLGGETGSVRLAGQTKDFGACGERGGGRVVGGLRR